MPKVYKAYNQQNEFIYYVIHCLACGCGHAFDHRWDFNNDLENPTFIPSMLVNKDQPNRRCHSFVTNGKIQYLTDCWHEFKGMTLDLPNIDEV